MLIFRFKVSLTLREEHGHGLPQYVVEAGDDEHLLGADHVVDQHVREDRAEQADARREHYERCEHTADV